MTWKWTRALVNLFYPKSLNHSREKISLCLSQLCYCCCFCSCLGISGGFWDCKAVWEGDFSKDQIQLGLLLCSNTPFPELICQLIYSWRIFMHFLSSLLLEYYKETLLYSNLESDCLKMLILDDISSIKINSIRCQLYFLLFMQLVFLFLFFVVYWVYWMLKGVS